MHRWAAPTLLAGLALLGSACRANPVRPEEEVIRPCLPNGSEFPPSACALLVGTLIPPAGARPEDFLLIVDTVETDSARWFSSGPHRARPAGNFELLVGLTRPLGAGPVPAFTRVFELKVHRTDHDARVHQNIVHAMLVTIPFTPWGQLVQPTPVTVRMPSP